MMMEKIFDNVASFLHTLYNHHLVGDCFQPISLCYFCLFLGGRKRGEESFCYNRVFQHFIISLSSIVQGQEEGERFCSRFVSQVFQYLFVVCVLGLT